MNMIRFLAILFILSASSCQTETPPCDGWTLAAQSVVAGGRLELAIPAAAQDRLVKVMSGDRLEAWRDDTRVVVRANYEAGDDVLTLACDSGTITVPITVAALQFDPLTSWDASETAPAAREYFAWWLGDDNAIYLYGGFVYEPKQFTPSDELWRFDLGASTWAKQSQSGDAPPPGGRVVRGTNNAIFYQGGAQLDQDGALDTPPVLRHVAIAGGAATWTADAHETTSPGSYTGALVYDAPRDRLLSVCGVDARVLGLNCEVHAYSATDGFVALSVDGDLPDGRYGFHYGHDVVNDRVIVFGGQIGAANLAQAGDTWALELAPDGDATHPRWVRLFEATEDVPARRNGAYAYDPEGKRMFVWGGTSDGATAVAGLEVLNLDRGHERWTHVELPAAIPARASGAGVYDPTGHRIVWGFGNSNKGVFTDLYELRVR